MNEAFQPKNCNQQSTTDNQSEETSKNIHLELLPEDNEVQAPNGYKFMKTIGDGSFGKVKLGIHLLTEEKVAIKILCKQRIRERTDIERISRQIKIMKVVNHPFIVQMYEIIQSPKHLFLIMQFVEGGDLFDVISNQSKLSDQKSCSYFAQMILGLQYLHKLGITHRDMKPQNILIAENNRIKIADFGLGNFYKEGQKLKTACGSPCYAPPQMLNQEEYCPQKVDIWSSGVILYAMIHGYLPFQDDVTSLLYEKIKTKNLRVASWVSIPCRNLLRGVLTKDQNQRLNTSAIKAHQFLLQQIQKLQNYLNSQIGQINKQQFEQICEQLGIVEQQRLLSNLKKSKHNNLTTLYYLGKKKIIRELKSNIVTLQDNLQEHARQSQKENSDQIVETPRMPQSLQPIQLSKNIFSFSDKVELKENQSNSLQQVEQQISFSNSNIQISTITQKQEKAIQFSNIKLKQEAIQIQNKDQQKIQAESPNLIAVSPIQQSYFPSMDSSSAKEQIRQFIAEKHDEVVNQSPKNNKNDEKNMKIKNNQGKLNENKVVVKQIQKQRIKSTNDAHKKGQKDKQIKKQQKITKFVGKGLKKSERMPIYKPKQQNRTQAEIKLYQRSQSKDRPIILKNTLQTQKQKLRTKTNVDSGSHTVAGKIIHIQPHLIDADKLVLCSSERFCQILSKKGYSGKIQYFNYNKQCILIARINLKASKSGNKLISFNEIQKIINDINQSS